LSERLHIMSGFWRFWRAPDKPKCLHSKDLSEFVFVIWVFWENLRKPKIPKLLSHIIYIEKY
jgi:hypothetical protein